MSAPRLARILALALALTYAQAAVWPVSAAVAGQVPVRPVAAAGAACLAAADRAALRHGVPPGVLRAIALAESGTRRGGEFRPWPWTLNVEGQGFHFDDRAGALAHARAALARGARSVDLGCFQINHRWHGAAFPSLDAMLDPETGADYAATFLAALHAESGDWLTAAGHYHSRTAPLAARYRSRVETLLARAGDGLPGAPGTGPGPSAAVASGRAPTLAAIAGPAARRLPLISRAAAPEGRGPSLVPRRVAGGLFLLAGATATPDGPRRPLIGAASGPLFGGS